MKILTALLLTSSILFAQNDSVYKFVLPELFIEITRDTLDEIYHFENDNNIFYLNSMTIKADTNKYKFNTTISNMKSIRLRTGVATYSGAFYGGFIGSGLGLATGILHAIAYQPKTIEVMIALPGYAAAGFIAGALIGGVMGSLIPSYSIFERYSSDLNVKKDQLRKFLYKNDINRKK